MQTMQWNPPLDNRQTHTPRATRPEQHAELYSLDTNSGSLSDAMPHIQGQYSFGADPQGSSQPTPQFRNSMGAMDVTTMSAFDNTQLPWPMSGSGSWPIPGRAQFPQGDFPNHAPQELASSDRRGDHPTDPSWANASTQSSLQSSFESVPTGLTGNTSFDQTRDGPFSVPPSPVNFRGSWAAGPMSSDSSTTSPLHPHPRAFLSHSKSMQLGVAGVDSVDGDDLASIPESVDRRGSAVSLSDQYIATDEQRAQDILKVLRSRAPDSKEGVAACDYCRKRRIKCDREKPTCGRCAIAGRLCTTSDTLRKRGPPSKKEREYLAAQGIQFVPSRVRRRSAAMDKAEQQTLLALAGSSFAGLSSNQMTHPGYEGSRAGSSSGPTSVLTSPNLSPSRDTSAGPQRSHMRRHRSDTLSALATTPYTRNTSEEGTLSSANPSPVTSRDLSVSGAEDINAFAQLVLDKQAYPAQGDQVDFSGGGPHGKQPERSDSNTNMTESSLAQAQAWQTEPQHLHHPQQTLILNHQGDIESVDTASLPATITDLVRASKSGEDYWASMSITSGDSSSILSFSERLLRHEISRYLILCYFKNYHNRFPFAYEPWIWQAMESVQQSNGSTFRLQAGTQALLLSIIAMASCGAEPWKTPDGQPVNLWYFGHAAHQACVAIVDPPILHDKGVESWAQYTHSILSPDLAQSFILLGGYLMNDGPEAVWRSIQLGWDICRRQGFMNAKRDLLQRGSMSHISASEICKEQGIRTVWALMKLSVTIYLTGRIKTWPRFLVEFDADLPSALHDPSDPDCHEKHLNLEALETWSSAMPINRLLLEILTSPLNADWAQQQQQHGQGQGGQSGNGDGQMSSPSQAPTISLDEKRTILHGFDMAIEQWKQDAECLKSHRAMPLSRSGDEDYAWVSVNSKTRVILRIAEERLSEAHQAIVAEADGIGQPVSDEERKAVLLRINITKANVAAAEGIPVQDRVSAWFQTVEDENLAWYCGSVPASNGRQ